jgi:hypothetical protein
MGDSEGGSEQDDVSFLRTVYFILNFILMTGFHSLVL